jgi:hypothetical protein
MTDLLVGTDQGLLALNENGGAWDIAAKHLDGLEINGVAREKSGTVLVATRSKGLHRLDLNSGKTERLGEGVLPDKTRCVTVSPHDPQKIFVGTEPAGIFISLDGGRNWRENRQVAQMNLDRGWKFPIPIIGSHIRHILADAKDPNYVYAAVQVGGLLRSEDGGETWQDVDQGLDPDVHQLVQHPGDSKVIYAVCGSGGYPGVPGDFSTYPPPFPQGRPLYRSKDRGKTWECISKDFKRAYGVPMTAIPGKKATLFAAVARDIPPFWGKRPEKADAVLIRSEDDGDSWKEVGDGLPAPFGIMIEVIEADEKRGNRVFIATGGEGMKMLPENERKGQVFYSGDNGAWKKVPKDFPSVFTVTPV